MICVCLGLCDGKGERSWEGWEIGLGDEEVNAKGEDTE